MTPWLFIWTLLRRCKAWCLRLLRSPVLRHRPTAPICQCGSPIFVRCSGGSRCEFCGGKQRCANGGFQLPRGAHGGSTDCVTVAAGLDFREGAGLIRGAISLHLAAVNISFIDFAAMFLVALGESRRNFHFYKDACARATLRDTPRSCDGEGHCEEVSLDVLRRTVYALRFALAVYALPYELGCLGSVWRGLQLWTLRHNRRYVHATTEEQVFAIYRILCGKVRDPLLEVVCARYSCSLGQPCFAVFLDHNLRRVVVAFRGTLSIADMVSNLACGYIDMSLGTHYNAVTGEMEEIHTRVPRGFYENVMEASEHILPVLDKVRQQHPDYALMCVGHSLGAVEAILFHLLFFFLPRQGVSMHTIVFSPPPCVEYTAVERINELLGKGVITSWFYGLDGVARLQVCSVLSLFHLLSAATESLKTKSLPLFSIPGCLLHITAGSTDVINVPINAPWRNQVILRRDALLHHFPFVFSAALYRVFLARAKRDACKG